MMFITKQVFLVNYFSFALAIFFSLLVELHLPKNSKFSKMSVLKIVNQVKVPLREKCPNTEFFLVRIFLYSD